MVIEGKLLRRREDVPKTEEKRGDVIERVTKSVQGMLNYKPYHHQLKEPLTEEQTDRLRKAGFTVDPKFKDVEELICDTAEHYKGR